MSVLALGLMSGTSLDGIDASLVTIERDRLRLEAFATRPYAAAERAAILHVVGGGASVREVALLDRHLGEWFAEAGRGVLETAGISAGQLEFVASHGQTVWHEPGRATLQIGSPHTIAERLGVRVISDFRSRDVAAGGQGAPLVPLADAMLFGHAQHPRALLNVGGMANVTWVPRLGSLDGVTAFDTGPGVAVVDAVSRMVDPTEPFDRDGVHAARGQARLAVLEALLADSYFHVPPPKSTGRETFGTAFAEQLVHTVREREPGANDDDLVATALAFTVVSVADQLSRWLPAAEDRDLVVSGGGARNPVLMDRLAATLDGWTVARFDDEFFDGDAKEAAVFAYLGWRALLGEPGNVPAATGAEGLRVLGSVTL